MLTPLPAATVGKVVLKGKAIQKKCKLKRAVDGNMSHRMED